MAPSVKSDMAKYHSVEKNGKQVGEGLARKDIDREAGGSRINYSFAAIKCIIFMLH